MKKKNITFINDSKATSYKSTKYALLNSKNIYWILGGLPKPKDKILLSGAIKNINKCYLVGKNINFFQKQIKKKIKYQITYNLKKSLFEIFKDIKKIKNNNSTILLSPAAASFDQFENFEKRGKEFKRLSRLYARKFI